jgi:DNA gyrase subunit A
MVEDESDLMFITNRGKLLRTSVKNIRAIGRNTQGVRMMVLEDDELIVSVAKLAEKDTADGVESAEEAIEAGVDTTGSPEEEV